jgi:hypothetical protein
MRLRDISHRLNDIPFKPFRIHLSDGSSVIVRDSGGAILGQSSVVLPTEYDKDEEGFRFAKHWRTIAYSHMVQFREVDETVEGKRRKRK